MTGLLAQAAGTTMSNETMVALAAVLLGLAVVLILAEIFFVSFGVLTAASVASVAGAWILAFRVSPGTGVLFVILSVVLLPAAAIAGIKYLPRTGWGRRLIPLSPKPEDVVATGVDDLESLVGAEGTTMSMCRPAGMAEFNGERYDVVSESMVIAAGARVKVIDVEGNRVVVREIIDVGGRGSV